MDNVQRSITLKLLAVLDIEYMAVLMPSGRQYPLRELDESIMVEETSLITGIKSNVTYNQRIGEALTLTEKDGIITTNIIYDKETYGIN